MAVKFLALGLVFVVTLLNILSRTRKRIAILHYDLGRQHHMELEN